MLAMPVEADPREPDVSGNRQHRARVPAAPPEASALRSATGLALIAATVLASTVGFLNAYMINVAVPAIAVDLHATVSELQWVLTGYLVTVAALLLLSGALADRFGRRRGFAGGLGVVVAASVLCGVPASIICAVAPSIGALIVARLIQGVGAALVVPSGLALLNGTLRVADRARGIGVWAGLATLGATVGPYAAGWLVDHASWRWVFLLNIPLIIGALIALRQVPETSTARGPLSLDVRGAMLAVIGLGGLVYALTAGPTSGWLRAGVVVSGILGIASLAALVPVERGLPAPMLRLSLFLSRPFDALNVTTLLFYGACGILMAAAAFLWLSKLDVGASYTE